MDRRRTRNYHGEEGPLEISFITGGTVNPTRIDTMMVQRRHHGAADLSHSERSNCSILEIKAERRNLAKMVFEGMANFSGKGEEVARGGSYYSGPRGLWICWVNVEIDTGLLVYFGLKGFGSWRNEGLR